MTPSSLKDRDGMWNHSQHTPANSSGKCRNPKSGKSLDSHPPYPLTRKTAPTTPRSTVATITEIYDYLRVLFSRVGVPHCSSCGHIIEKVSKDEIVRRIEGRIRKEKMHTIKKSTTRKKARKTQKEDTALQVFAPVVIGRKGEYYQLLYDTLRKGYETARIDGADHNLRNRINLGKNTRHDIDIYIDTLPMSEYAKDPRVFRERLSDAVERSVHEADGLVRVQYPDGEEDLISSRFLCPACGLSFPEIEPRLFSFNSPYGACPDCNGLGQVDIFNDEPCHTCRGKRLRPEALSVFLTGKKGKHTIHDIIGLTVEEASLLFDTLTLGKQQQEIAAPLLNEIISRISFLENVGLEYMTLNRKANTLSGGEAQRIRLASQIGSGLVGAVYVLDEPTIGLHQRDNNRLIRTLLQLRDLGNTIIVVEHDEDTIFAADYIIDIGPGAGKTRRRSRGIGILRTPSSPENATPPAPSPSPTSAANERLKHPRNAAPAIADNSLSVAPAPTTFRICMSASPWGKWSPSPVSPVPENQHSCMTLCTRTCCINLRNDSP